MCEVSRGTFAEIAPIVEQHIKAADFIAIDTEFTGLKLPDKDKPSLFDSGEDRYKKLRKSVKQFSISQIGISAFVRTSVDANTYHAYSYNFYLFPSSFGPIDVRFLVQASSFEFLTKYNFDFNKYVQQGVSFMNESQEATLRSYFDSMAHVKGLDRDVDERTLQEYCSKVAMWVVKAEPGSQLLMETSGELPGLVLITELKQRFRNVWVTEDNGQVVVEKVSRERRVELDSGNRQQDEQGIMEKMLGFTKIFRMMTKCKKPLIGHNCFTDLMLIYDKFHKPLPEKYSTFKAEIMEMFPKVFDTKHLTLNLRKIYDETGLLENSCLGDLYQTLHSDKGRLHVLCSPTVVHGEGCQRYKECWQPHEAGYDAFMCGYVFIRIAHMHTGISINSSDIGPMAFSVYMEKMKPFTNCVNMIRASVNHVKLDDHDPLSLRPQWLFVQCCKAGHTLASDELAQMFSQYGSVDIQMQSPKQALVALTNHRSSREILKAFRKHDSVRIMKYNTWRHSTRIRALMWAGVVFFGSVSVWTLYSGFTNTRTFWIFSLMSRYNRLRDRVL